MLHRRQLRVPVVVVLGGIALALSAGPTIAQADEPFPHLMHAKWEMIKAKEEVEDKRWERHRKDIIADLDAAIEETNKALAFGKAEWKYEGPKDAKKVYGEYKEFPHLHHAIVELKEARKEVEGKAHEKYERKEHTVKAIDKAISRLEDAIKDIK
jgi:hypothetical protein